MKKGSVSLKIKKTSCIQFLAFLVIALVCLDKPLTSYFDENLYFVATAIAASFIVLSNGIEIVKKDKTFKLLLISILVSTFARGEGEYYLKYILLIYVIFVAYNLKESVFKIAIIASLIAVIPFLLKWFRAMFLLNKYAGNRFPLHISIVFALILYLNLTQSKNQWMSYTIIVINVILCFLGNSRTSLLAWSISLLVLIYLDTHDKLTKTKLLLLVLAIFVAAIILFLNFDAINQVVFHKWNRAVGSDIFASRLIMWNDVFSKIEWWGYPINYIKSKYGFANIHSSYIQAYTSFGIITGILNVICYIVSIIRVIINRKDYRMRAIIPIFISVLLIGFFESNFILDFEYPFLGIISAIIMGQIARIAKSIKCFGC